MPELKGDLHGIKTLKSLEQHEREEQIANKDELPRPNGIACPNCNKELADINPGPSLHSQIHPRGKKSILCQSCGYTGYRTA